MRMSSELDIHAASPDELVAAHSNVFDIWSKGLSLEAHVHSRLNSPKHRLADWYVGCVGGRVVVSLGCYPLHFRLRGRDVPGIAIGSVYTLADFRRRGFAAQLLGWVERRKQQDGVALSLLYSDINPGYYTRLGYVECPSLAGWRDLGASLPRLPETDRLVEVSTATHLADLAKLYADYHGAAPLSIARDADYWAALLQRFTSDRFFVFESAGRPCAGYARLGRQGGDWHIRDYALADQSDGLAKRFYTSMLAFGRETGASRVGGWLPDLSAARELFRVETRPTEITMIKPLAWSEPFEDDLISATSRFCEIDHV